MKRLFRFSKLIPKFERIFFGHLRSDAFNLSSKNNSSDFFSLRGPPRRTSWVFWIESSSTFLKFNFRQVLVLLRWRLFLCFGIWYNSSSLTQSEQNFVWLLQKRKTAEWVHFLHSDVANCSFERPFTSAMVRIQSFSIVVSFFVFWNTIKLWKILTWKWILKNLFFISSSEFFEIKKFIGWYIDYDCICRVEILSNVSFLYLIGYLWKKLNLPQKLLEVLYFQKMYKKKVIWQKLSL